MSVVLEIDAHGEVAGSEFCSGVIRSAERMTYTGVNLILTGDSGLRDRYSPLVAGFERMAELAEILGRRRSSRGSIDFDLPEPVIEFDQMGLVKAIVRAERNAAHRLIEEFMLAANEAVASLLENRAPASLYRVHEKPEPRRVFEFEEAAAAFGCSLGVGPLRARDFGSTTRRRDHTKGRRELILPEGDLGITSRHYQKLIARIAGRPEERILSYLMLRSLKQARYSQENLGHFALASPGYTHFTSPIRRYPDLVIHRLLKAVLGEKRQAAGEAALRAVAEECSSTERRAVEAERELMEWKKARFLQERLGEEFPGIVVGVTKYGLFIELADLFIEGLAPIETLPGDRYTYRESRRAIVGERKKRTFALGDRLVVRVDRVPAGEGKAEFAVVG